MEMDDLRWILLGVAVVIVFAVYFFSRTRKKEQSYMPLEEESEVPSFSAQEEVSNDLWQDGVGPVRVVEKVTALEDEPVQTDEKIEVSNKIEFNNRVDVSEKEELPVTRSGESIQPEAALSEQKPHEEKPHEEKVTQQSDPQVAIDDVISVYVLAMDKPEINGDKILSASYALHLDYGEMKIFHRHDQTAERKIQFSMASVQQPGWFEIDNMNEMKTTGVSFFMQVNLVDNASAVLDEMLICAHGLSKMLDVTLCNAQRKPLDEASTIALREKVKRLEAIKARTV